MPKTETDGDRPLLDVEKRITAFFYGTLMHPRILHRVVDSTDSPTAAHLARFTHTPALLRNFCRHKVRNCDYPGIVAEAGKSVRGVYVTGLDEKDLRLLDYFEGSQYVKEEVRVELLKGESLSGEGAVGDDENRNLQKETVKTQTYVFEDRDDLENEEWDFEKFKEEKLHNWVGASDEYDEVDAAGVNAPHPETATGHDPTGGRGIQHCMTK